MGDTQGFDAFEEPVSGSQTATVMRSEASSLWLKDLSPNR
jgi:hypothetical protein